MYTNKKKNLLISLAAAFSWLFADLAAEEIYKWQDENGHWHYTDRPPQSALRIKINKTTSNENKLPSGNKLNITTSSEYLPSSSKLNKTTSSEYLPSVIKGKKRLPQTGDTNTLWRNPTKPRNQLTGTHALKAFPNAQGSAADTPGGRGGKVYIVKNLNDSGTGSLRECVQASEPRTCVFAVSGIINLETPLWINKPFLTVAGQTAPGGGILITNKPGFTLSNLVGIYTNGVIWQYTKLRSRYVAACDESLNNANSECGALLSIFGTQDVILDHNSLSWNLDDAYGVWRGDNKVPLRNITFSNSIIAEGQKGHSTGLIVGATTAALGDDVTNIDIHHNLFMNNNHRNPVMVVKSGRVINNIFYNQRYYRNRFGGGGMYDVIGNYYMQGPLNANAGKFEIQGYTSDGVSDNGVVGSPSIYVAGNKSTQYPSLSTNQWALVGRLDAPYGREAGTAPTTWQRSTQLPFGKFPIIAENVDSIISQTGSIIPNVGASRRVDCLGNWVSNRDSVDTRLVQQYNTNTGITQLIANENEAGGMPIISTGTACTDTDNDGMPDAWETAKFGNKNQLPGADADGDGYTNLEEYIHAMP